MPWFLPAMAAGATIVLAKKLVARAWNEYFVQYATVDPPGFRTVALVGLAPATEASARLDIDDVLGTIAAELARDLPGTLEIVRDSVRAEKPQAGRVDVVRAVQRGAVWTVELTRAWTGVPLGDSTRRSLRRIDDALRSHSPALAIAWFAREDRGFAVPFDTPFDSDVATRSLRL